MQTIIIDRATLQALVDAADFGQDQKDHDAGRLEDDNGADQDTRDLRRVARDWRAAVRAALRLLRAPITVTARPMRMEVGAPRNGRPGYRWTTGYVVCDPNTGNEVHPPVLRAEAYALARQLGGKNARIVISDVQAGGTPTA